MSRRTRKLRRENKAARRALSYQNQYELDEIMRYFEGAPISDFQREQVHSDLIAMLLDGQARGVSAKSVIGDDPLDFCEAVLAAVPPEKPSNKLLLILRTFFMVAFIWTLSIFLLYQVVPWMRGAREGLIHLTLNDVLSVLIMTLALEAGRRWNNKRVRTTYWWKSVVALLFLILISVSVGLVQIAMGEHWFIIPQRIFAVLIILSGLLWAVFDHFVD